MRRQVSREARPTQQLSTGRILTVSTATVLTMLVVIFVVQDLARQPVLVTSLASSTFLLYYQPLNEINRFRPLVVGHLVSVAIGYAASLVLPIPYVAATVSLAASVLVLTSLRLVHPPAVSTSLVFAYRPHDLEAIATFLTTLGVVVALGALYLVLHTMVRPSRWAHLFGLHEGDERP